MLEYIILLDKLIAIQLLKLWNLEVHIWGPILKVMEIRKNGT